MQGTQLTHRVINTETNMSCVYHYDSAICVSMQTVHLSAQNSLAVAETNMELDSHADTCIVCDHCLIVHDHNRAVNIFGYNPKVG